MLKELKITDIKVGNRHRKDMGDLTDLTESIRQEGLLQPIGVTERLELVFGERRIRAVRDILKKKTVLARIVDVTSIIAGEYAENVVRKDFTPSERVAIARAIAAHKGVGSRFPFNIRLVKRLPMPLFFPKQSRAKRGRNKGLGVNSGIVFRPVFPRQA